MDGNRAVAYVRVSTDGQAEEGLSLGAQQAKVEAYCTLNGLELVELVVEPGVSASKIPLAKREGGARVVALSESGAVQHVIGMKLDRVFRNALDCLQHVEAWDKAGINLHFLDMGGVALNVSSAFGKMMVTMVAGFAEMEARLISERTKTALQFKKSQGAKLGGLRESTVLADEETIRRMVELKAQGLTLRAIATVLQAEGRATKRGGTWAPATIAKVLARQGAA